MTKPREVVLHIGHYKTGTTALQIFCERNRGLLAHQGLVYAREPVRNSKHSALAFSLLRDAGVTNLMYGFTHPASAAELWQALFDATRALPEGQAMLVSSEEFIRLGAHPAAVDLLRAQVATARDLRFRVIVYLRTPQAHLKSWYNQMVKSGIEDASFDAAILARTEAVHWDYGLALRPWIELFGPEAIVVRPFEPALRGGDRLFADFLEALGKTVPVFAETVDEDPNPRLDDRLLALRRGAARAEVHPEQTRQVMETARQGLAAEAATGAARRGFDALRAEAEAGIEALSALPGAALDLARMRADLPRPQDPLEQRLDETIALLVTELMQMRARVARQAARIKALETQAGKAPPQPGRPT
ncbi:MAG: hypothetical protein ACK4GT_00410 [Pararhodobacter sp.]